MTRMTLLGSEHSVLIRSKFRSGKIFHTEPLSSTLFGIEGGGKKVQKYRILFIPFNDLKSHEIFILIMCKNEIVKNHDSVIMMISLYKMKPHS